MVFLKHLWRLFHPIRRVKWCLGMRYFYSEYSDGKLGDSIFLNGVLEFLNGCGCFPVKGSVLMPYGSSLNKDNIYDKIF